MSTSSITASCEVPRHAIKRLQSEYKQLKSDPERYIHAEPDPKNILHWHYVITGPPDTPYYNGIYHGMLKFPKEYPFKAPQILMFTPNGRFLTNKPLCLSMSSYHPEKWNPAWGVGTILVGLLSFMTSNESDGKALGMMKTSDKLKSKLAEESFEFNRKTDRVHGEIFNDLFTIFMWEEEERRQHRLRVKKRKLQQEEENNNNSQKSSDSSLSDLSNNSEKSDSDEENIITGSNSTISSNGEGNNSEQVSFDSDNKKNDFKRELEEAESNALKKFDRSRSYQEMRQHFKQMKKDEKKAQEAGRKDESGRWIR